MKSRPGRGRKRDLWRELLQDGLLEEFILLRSMGMKVSRTILRDAAMHLLNSYQLQVNINQVTAETGKPIESVINSTFVGDFCNRFRITYRIKSGNKPL